MENDIFNYNNEDGSKRWMKYFMTVVLVLHVLTSLLFVFAMVNQYNDIPHTWYTYLVMFCLLIYFGLSILFSIVYIRVKYYL